MPSLYVPETLRELVACIDNPEGRHPALRCFLDAFYIASKEDKQIKISEEPPLTENEYFNAYLAAVAEHLAWDYALKTPSWCFQKNRFLRSPIFTNKLEGTKGILFVDSPSAFRRRMIFTGHDPLSRPLKYGKTLFEKGRDIPGRFPVHSKLPVLVL